MEKNDQEAALGLLMGLIGLYGMQKIGEAIDKWKSDLRMKEIENIMTAVRQLSIEDQKLLLKRIQDLCNLDLLTKWKQGTINLQAVLDGWNI